MKKYRFIPVGLITGAGLFVICGLSSISVSQTSGATTSTTSSEGGAPATCWFGSATGSASSFDAEAAGGGGSLFCVSSSGKGFSNNKTVSSGYYFHVTDVLITPSEAGKKFLVKLYHKTGSSTPMMLAFANKTGNSIVANFGSPAMVLDEGDYLHGSNGDDSDARTFVTVLGLIKTESTFP